MKVILTNLSFILGIRFRNKRTERKSKYYSANYNDICGLADK